MEDLVTESGRYLITQGVLGVIVLVLGVVNWLQYRENRSTNGKRFDELQRIIDARESVAKALNVNSLALEANNRSMDLRTRATEEMVREIGELRRVVEASVQQTMFADERVKELMRRIDDYLRPKGAA